MNLFLYPEKKDWKQLLARPVKDKQNLDALVSEIFAQVRQFGDEAIREYSLKFDGAAPSVFKVSKSEITAATKKYQKT